MKRRELIFRLAAGFSTLKVSASLADVVSHYPASEFASTAGASGASRADTGRREGMVLSRAQLSFLATVVDCVIPDTDTPGASAAGVPAFIDYLLGHAYAEMEQRRFTSGLLALEKTALRRSGEPFVQCTSDQQLQLLTGLEAGTHPPGGSPEATEFVKWMKELTVLGYYTSEIGATQELNYQAMPGPYQGCIDFAEVGRTWAL